jgi:hypothetical protein
VRAWNARRDFTATLARVVVWRNEFEPFELALVLPAGKKSAGSAVGSGKKASTLQRR